MNRIPLYITGCVFLLGFSLTAAVQPDVPAEGEYAFPLLQIWQTDSAGDMPLARPANIRVDGEGMVYCYDRRNLKYLIYDSSGQFVRAFGKKGEGPGEIRRIEQAPLYLVEDILVVLDTGRLHYFDRRGNFIKSVVYQQQGRPVAFINKDEFLTAPRTIIDIPEGKAAIHRVNLLTGKKELITTFDVFRGGALSNDNIQAAMVDPRLTPLMTLGHHGERLYFGMSDRYEIHICNMEGGELGVFGLDRAKTKVSDEVKTENILRLAKGRAPEELLRTLIKKLPSEETYFFNIEVHGGLIHVFCTHFDRKNSQQIDIFSADGKYLHRGILRIGEGDTVLSGPVLKGGFVYMVVENEDGEVFLRKYQTTMPGAG
jgi:hypothetical protein